MFDLKITSKARYGLKICCVLAGSPDSFLSAAQIADITGYSVKYTEKIMVALKKAKIVIAEKGVSGGYKLSKIPQKITLGDIIRPLEDNLEFVKCVGAVCANEKNCPSHGVWKKLYNGINELLDGMTLNEIAESGGELYDKRDISGQCGDYKC